MMRLGITSFAVTMAIWLAAVALPDDSGLKFGWPYNVFFTLMIAFSAAVLYLQRLPPTAHFQSSRAAVASVLLVFLISIGAITLIANLSPQFGYEAPVAAGETAEEKGKAVYSDPNNGCFLCHNLNGSGGTRGPELSHIATVAARRKAGMSAEDYIRESLVSPGAYVVSPYDNIMPSYGKTLSPEALDVLIAYLKGLK